MIRRNILHISGIVQGVGFRPYVYSLALRYGLYGFVQNDGQGVVIEVEGEEEKLDLFFKTLYKELPPLARIDSIEKKETNHLKKEQTFSIIESRSTIKKALVSPDISLCDACLAEFNDTTNRRYGYFAINCTHCGPRYSIIKTVPYDRASTSMDRFTMCHQCEAEYIDPANRRYHAQPISCYECGPTLTLYDNLNREIKTENIPQFVSSLLQEGAIIAIKGLGGFHLMCNAYDDNSVSKLRQRKSRPSKPFAVLFPTIDSIEGHAMITSSDRTMIQSKEKPIVLVQKKENTPLSKYIAPLIDRIGVMLPYTPLQFLLFKYFKNPLIATSANLKSEPIVYTKEMLFEKLGKVVDYVLDMDRDIVNAVDDSVVQLIDKRPMFLRLARGFTPCSFHLPFKVDKHILAVGAEQKNTIALAFDDQVILSPYIGDLVSLDAMEYFERTLETFKRFYDFSPEMIVCDKHPSYTTTFWAKEQKLPLLQVQHHHAHILSVLFEQNIHTPVLGIAFDGTGYGDNGTLWGGEFLRIEQDYSYTRVSSFKPLVLLGGNKAIQEPRRIALSLAFDVMDLSEIKQSRLAKHFTPKELELLDQAYQKQIRTIDTSSVGRLFDGVASLLDIVQILSFDGESGLKMEQYYDPDIPDFYHFYIENGIIYYDEMIKALFYEHNQARGVSMFMNTLIEIIITIAHTQKLPLVFSGGVFQNKVLVEKLVQRLRQEKITYYFPQYIPPNDSSIALGQIAYTLQQLKLPK
ncbi:carbamoyltransferase HypF [Sulfurovum sp. zt1-1]|uniref:Carbamoyltransferase n=1 Tax=Sulfurovum zhangzhouensis TaxID=3019067 RepID=A0ABT7QWC8_9BACT|nr:carbamoyltransferase HypF [Sulfurovum zhangzhouensis]MDM5271133.1 carbamoyltransferase HypF [Sulfurovum zhangzhouensis]